MPEIKKTEQRSFEKSKLRVDELRVQGEHADRKMGYALIGALVALGMLSLFIPGANGLEFSKTIILPAITGILGFAFSSRRPSE